MSGRGLSIHEAVLPQSAREMLADGDFLIPKRGGNPWLESPPMPQWMTITLAAPFGRCDSESIVRLGAVLAAMVTVFLVAWMASVWFGRSRGLLAGFVMATTAQFTRYSWLSEDEIFLCVLVTIAIAVFVKLEFDPPASIVAERDAEKTRGWLRSFFAGRPAWVLGLFAAIGMTNLAKGFLFGTGMAVIPMAGYLLLSRDSSRIKRYVWLWGWLVFVGIAMAWPLAVLSRYPDAWEVWFADLGGRMTGDYQPSIQPIWYYPQNLLWMLAPWTPAALLGLGMTYRNAKTEKTSPERFLWCWALLVPMVFSLPEGKNHHYLLHALAPWAMLGTLGVIRIQEWCKACPAFYRQPRNIAIMAAVPIAVALFFTRPMFSGPSWLPLMIGMAAIAVVYLWTWGVQHPMPRTAAAVVFLIVGGCYLGLHWGAGHYADKHRFDVAFLRSVEGQCTEKGPLLVDCDVDALRAFLCLFYLPEDALPLHNLSFLKNEPLASGEVYLLTRERKLSEIPGLERWRMISQSERTGGETSPEDRLTLFRCTLKTKDPQMTANPVRVSPMQTMFRKPGPVLQ